MDWCRSLRYSKITKAPLQNVCGTPYLKGLDRLGNSIDAN